MMAIRIWQRMRLPYTAAALIMSGSGSLILAGVSWLGGYSIFITPIIWPMLIGLLALSGSILLYIEARVYPEKWQAWNAAIRDSTILDLLLGRHLPKMH